MGMKIAIMFFLLGFMMNGIFTLRVQAILDRGVQQLLNTPQERYTEMAQNDETKEKEKNEPVLDSEQKGAQLNRPNQKTPQAGRKDHQRILFPRRKFQQIKRLISRRIFESPSFLHTYFSQPITCERKK
jgi:hypothetical protein